jgi:hypothetical protein
MMFDPTKRDLGGSALFQVSSRQVYALETGKADHYKHTFGGASRHSGVVPAGGKQPLHLLYSLDTSDPKLTLKIPGVRWLPLYHGFIYDNRDVGYRVLSDSAIEILHVETTEIAKDFPYANYPTAFPKLPAWLSDSVFDPTEPVDVFLYRTVFGYEWLTADQRDALHQFMATSYREIEEHEPPETFEELAEEHRWYLFSNPPYDPPCPNKDCPNHATRGKMHILAVIVNEVAPGIYLYGKYLDDVQLIFQICPTCHAIYTTCVNT